LLFIYYPLAVALGGLIPAQVAMKHKTIDLLARVGGGV
jgi:hypothetical protein